MITEHTVSWSLGDTWCRIVGDLGEGVPLVVVHGGPAMSWDYLVALDDLATANRPVVFYDQIGGRRSQPHGTVDWNVEVFVDELGAVAAGLGLSAFDLLGHSWGATVAMEYAARRNSLVRRLVLASPAPSTEMLLDGWRQLLGVLPGVNLGRIEEMERSGNVAEDEYRRACELFERTHFCRLQPVPPHLERSMNALAVDVYERMWGPFQFRCTGVLRSWDITDRLARVTAPALVVRGEHDQVTQLCARTVASTLPQSELLVVPGASHMAHDEAPAAYFEVVSAFLDTP